MNELKYILISDFTINNLSGYLSNFSDEIKLLPVIAPYNQVQQVLLNPNLECWNSNPDFAVVFCQTQSIIKSFNALLNHEAIELNVILTEVDEFIEQLKHCSSRVKFTLVSSFSFNPNCYNGASAFDMNSGVSYVISKMNIRLAEKLPQSDGFYILDSQRWISKAGVSAFQPKLWYLSKTPFHHSVFEYAAQDINAVVKTITGRFKKLIIVDLDDTMWGGIVGDNGWENILLGGHHPQGEAHVDFQKSLLALSNKGIQLAIVSKNEEDIALTAIENHPEMILRKNNFVAWKINWKDKAQNIIDISKELKLGLDSIVFIDDNPAERSRVREALPTVFVPELPEDKLLYPSFIQQLDCFYSASLSKEDLKRTFYYKDEQSRAEDMSSFQSLDAWLSSINITIKIEPVTEINSQRVSQLFNKTNQMNLSTRRLTEKEIIDLSKSTTNSWWAISFTDKFGEAGLIGVLSIEYTNEIAKILDFILSCRVMGRKCEETMLFYAIKLAKQTNCKKLLAEYKATEKNKPCLDFFKASGMAQHNDTFSWDLNKAFALPSYIQLLN